VTFRRALPIVAALLALALAGMVVFVRMVRVHSDMTDFLPPGETPAVRLLLEELRSGAAASLLLIGIDGAAPEELARISRSVAIVLRASGLFRVVANETEGFAADEQEFLFDRRYLLSPATTASAFTVEGLHANLVALLAQLSGSAAPLVKRTGFSDPLGAWVGLAEVWLGASRVELREGVWFAAGADRALLLATSAVSALDASGGRAVLDAVEAAFWRAGPGEARLLLSGPGAFAVESAEAIHADVRLVSVVSVLFVTAFLLWRHRSAYILAAAAIPLAAGVVAGALAVQLAHGFVHAITLGFGLAMLGVAADYPLLLIGQRAGAESTRAAARRIWATMSLAALTAALGLTAMLLSSFPGLAQLGLFSAVGLVTAALVTRWVLPLLVEDVAFRGQQVTPAWLCAAAALRARRIWLAAPVAAGALYLAAAGGPAWESELENLSPVPAQARALDEELRRQLGAPDVRHLIAMSGTDAEAVLQLSERLEGTVRDLTEQGAIGSAELPSRYLPSRRTQRKRQAALPPADELERRIIEAIAGLPFRPEVFAQFIAGVAAQRAMPPVTPTDFDSAVLAARFDPLLFKRDTVWHGLAVLTDVRSPELVRESVAALGEPALAYIDLKVETERMMASYTREALTWVAVGGTSLLIVLIVACRRLTPVLSIAAPIACALLVTLALLDLLAIRLTLFHLASLLLVAGVSIDYALFLSRSSEGDADEDSRTLGSVLNCSATTLLTFGLLAFCRNPVLHGIGVTVASGVLAGVIFAVGLSRRPRTVIETS
jgi:predicted exporter